MNLIKTTGAFGALALVAGLTMAMSDGATDTTPKPKKHGGVVTGKIVFDGKQQETKPLKISAEQSKDCCPPGVDMDTAAANAFLAGQLNARKESRRLMMIRPNDSPDTLDLDGGWSGFKVYHCFSNLHQTQDALIDHFLPEWAWEIAHERKWAIMLHMVRQRSLADPENTSQISAMCRRHPNARLILAHAARGC